jgi:hypothetical protein
MKRAVAWLKSLWGFVREDPRRLLIVGVALVAGGFAGAPTGQAAYEYMWLDARFCDDCHVHDYANEGWERSIHAGVTTCHDCHRVPIRHYPRNLFVTIQKGAQTQEEMHAPDVATVICEQCHAADGAHEPLTGPLPEDLRARVVKIDASPLHRVHLEAASRTPARYLGGADPDAQGEAHDEGGHEGDAHAEPSHGGGHGEGEATAITCMDCHGSESNRAHQFAATMQNCVSCHEGNAMHAGRMQSLSCRDCHFEGFLGGPGEGGAAPAH